MRNRSGGQFRLEEAFRQELFRLINQYLSFPEDATLGTIGRTLVNFQQVSAVLEAYDSTLVIVGESCGKQPCTRPRAKPGHAAKEKLKDWPRGRKTAFFNDFRQSRD